MGDVFGVWFLTSFSSNALLLFISFLNPFLPLPPTFLIYSSSLSRFFLSIFHPLSLPSLLSLLPSSLCSSILQFNFPSLFFPALPPAAITVNLEGKARKPQSGSHRGKLGCVCASVCVFLGVIQCSLVCGEREGECSKVCDKQRDLGGP